MSIKVCLATKPPLVVFVVSLCAIALTTLILSAVVNGKDRIRNPDILDWNGFFYKVSQLEYCVDQASKTEESSRVTRNLNQVEDNDSVVEDVEETTSYLLVPMSTDFVASVNQAVEANKKSKNLVLRGGIVMDHMDKGRLGKYSGMNVTLTLVLPRSHDPLLENVDICMAVAGPKLLLDDMNSGEKPGPCSLPEETATSEVVKFTSHTPDHIPFRWCANGTRMELTYEPQPGWVVYISEADKGVIYLHLMCTSAFLFALVGCILAFMAFRGVRRSPKYATKSVGDDRGDLQLLPQTNIE